MADAITTALTPLACAGCSESQPSTATPYLSLINPGNPYAAVSLTPFTNWKIVSVSGIDSLADAQLTTTSTSFQSGVNVVDQRSKEKNITIVLEIRTCKNCDIFEINKTLFDLVNCSFCSERKITDYCCGDLICFKRPFDERYCDLLIQCCGIQRSIPVIRTGSVGFTKLGFNRYQATLNFIAPTPYFHSKDMQSVFMEITDADKTGDCPDKMNIDGLTNINNVNMFEKEVTFSYGGNIKSYPKITINGCVSDLKISTSYSGTCSDDVKGSQIRFSDECFKLPCECGVHVFNFQEGQRSFTYSDGVNAFKEIKVGQVDNCGEISGGCGQFAFLPSCDEKITLKVEGVNACNLKIRFDFFPLFDGFYKAKNEPAEVDYCKSGYPPKVS